jgi:glyoxylase-like metal-dependent hydrolase (beta-lactamase superfamily II)
MKITEKIHQIRIDFEIQISPERKIPRFVNVIVIFGDEITLIDTGVKQSEKQIFDYIVQNGRNISEIKNIILSHSHPDHIGSAADIKEITGCLILAHASEKEWIENIEIQNRERPVPGFFNLVSRPVKIDSFITDNLLLNPAVGITAKIMQAPGHSNGSLNVLFIEDRILFTADSIPLKNDIPNYASYRDLMNSLGRIKSMKDYDVILTSWTPALNSRSEIERIISEGEEYMMKIDSAVKEYYYSQTTDPLYSCRQVIEKLGLPPFLVTEVVNIAFLSHLK